MRTLAVIQLAGNALLLWIGYYWLGLGESSGAALAWSALVALVLLTLECWLQGAAFAYFADAGRLPLRRVPLLVAVAVVLLAVYWVLAQGSGFLATPAFKIASWLTLTFRKPVKPAAVSRAFDIVLWLVRWMVLPALALPIVARIAGGARSRRWWFWVATPVLLVCAFWVPLKLMGWTPQTGGFKIQMLSFVARLLAAYLLFVGAWLALVFLTSGGRPRATQSSTVASP
jgi:hypothetical protein